MRKNFLFFTFILSYVIQAQLTIPTIEWQKSLGGSHEDIANSIVQTKDGGYIIAGHSNSIDGDTTWNWNNDFWIVKLNNIGSIEWQKSFGGSNGDIANSIKQTSDGGYIIAGKSNSNNVSVSGNHGGNDYWIIKLDNNGILQWQKSLGGSLDDIAYSVDQVLDGGYVIAGKSNSNDGDVTNHHGSSMYYDSWIVKLDTNGNIEWQNSIGGNNDDIGLSIKQTSDGGFIVGGNSWSNDGDVTGHHGPTDNQYEWNPDQWIVKLNSFGIIQWQKSFGGTGDDRVGSVEETDDGGYIIGGSSWSNDGDITGHKSRSDYWIVKINIIGDIQWEKSFGGSGDDFAGNIKQTIDKGYLLCI